MVFRMLNNELFSLNACFPQTNFVDLVGKITGGIMEKSPI